MSLSSQSTKSGLEGDSVSEQIEEINDILDVQTTEVPKEIAAVVRSDFACAAKTVS
jgi:hypothetical protein